jgi:hypothetical protein
MNANGSVLNSPSELDFSFAWSWAADKPMRAQECWQARQRSACACAHVTLFGCGRLRCVETPPGLVRKALRKFTDVRSFGAMKRS